MTIAREEIFGPVLAMIPYEDEDDAVRIANDTVYGLSGYVSGDTERAPRDRPAHPHRQGAPQRRAPDDPTPRSAATSSRATAASGATHRLRGVPRDQGGDGLDRS